MTNMYGKGPRGKATKLHSLVVRQAGVCARCGVTGVPMDTAHIIPRRYAATRCDPENAWCLCKGCHRRTGEWAEDHMALVADTIGLDRYWELKRRAEVGVKATDAYWQDWCDRLSALLKVVA